MGTEKGARSNNQVPRTKSGDSDVIHLAGHADFQTTHRFYLAVREDLIDRTREITQANSVANLLQQANKATEATAGNTTSL